MRVGRVVLFFLTAFGSIVIPVAVLLVYGILTYQSPFAVDVPADVNVNYCQDMVQKNFELKDANFSKKSQYKDAEYVIQVRFKSGGRALLIKYPVNIDISDKFLTIWGNIPTSSAFSVLDYITYQRSDNKLYGSMFFDNSWIVISEAPVKKETDEQLKKLPVLKEQEPSPFITIGKNYFSSIFIIIGIYCLILVFVWLRLASWSASIEKRVDSVSIKFEDLKKRLMELNELEVPFSVIAGKLDNELIIEWKYADTKWVGLMSLGKLKYIASIKLRFDDISKCVRAQETLYKVKWHIAKNTATSMDISASWFRGINFYQYDIGFIGGLIIAKDGIPKLSTNYSWNFNIDEIKKPLIDIITSSGWNWRPVVTFLRFLNG